jgi:hypothetical protein
MRYLAYIKNDVLGERVEDIICKKMIKDWKRMSILDVGSGPCHKEEKRRFRGKNITCFDIFKPYLNTCRLYGFKTVNGDARKLNKYFSNKSFDIVWLIDVIEHMSKDDGYKLMANAEKIARKQVLISTPLGWYPQDHECVDEPWKGGNSYKEVNKYQDHVSAWYLKDLEKRGYTCEVRYDYHRDIRCGSKVLQNKPKPVTASQMWAVKILQ